MNRTLKALARAAVILVIAGTFTGATAQHTKPAAKHGDLVISEPWARATPKGAKVAGGFMTIHNTGQASDTLIGGSFSVSERVEIHEMAVVNDIMRMRELPDGLEIKPGETVVLKPGSYHVMFMGLQRQLVAGETVEGTLVFKSAGSVNVTYTIGQMGAKMGHGDNHGGDHGKMKH
jgi:periplasmic copper chaperone A